jgi:hypothetical protein
MKKTKLNIEKFRISKLTNPSKIFGGDDQGETILGEVTKTLTVTRIIQVPKA